jgi:hypothetical protein
LYRFRSIGIGRRARVSIIAHRHTVNAAASAHAAMRTKTAFKCLMYKILDN